jgi:hypothetical protein
LQLIIGCGKVGAAVACELSQDQVVYILGLTILLRAALAKFLVLKYIPCRKSAYLAKMYMSRTYTFSPIYGALVRIWA